jgi:hypothetical protein
MIDGEHRLALHQRTRHCRQGRFGQDRFDDAGLHFGRRKDCAQSASRKALAPDWVGTDSERHQGQADSRSLKKKILLVTFLMKKRKTQQQWKTETIQLLSRFMENFHREINKLIFVFSKPSSDMH